MRQVQQNVEREARKRIEVGGHVAVRVLPVGLHEAVEDGRGEVGAGDVEGRVRGLRDGVDDAVHLGDGAGDAGHQRAAQDVELGRVAPLLEGLGALAGQLRHRAAEERAAAFISEYVTKPVVGYVAGFTAPEGKTMGHAGAIVSGSSGTAQAKKDALEAAGVKVGKTPSESAQLMRAILGR